MTMDDWQYLIVLAACLAVTAPLEMFGAGVYRQAWRTAGAVLPVAALFVLWDAVAIAAHVWTYNPRFVTGLELPGSMPVEELLFFVVIPLCGLLTYNAVDTILELLRRARSEAGQRS
jgi:lycopene cyclase domain-containing protein